MVNKNALRAGVVCAGTTLMLLTSSSAFAVSREDGDDPGPGLSVAQTLGLFVGIPVLVFLLICALVTLSEKHRTNQQGQQGQGDGEGGTGRQDEPAEQTGASGTGQQAD